MKIVLLTAALLLTCGQSFAMTGQQLHEIMRQCQVLTGTRTRVSWITNQAAANQCYRNTLDAIRQEEIEQSIIDVNNAEAAFYRDRTRLKNRDR